MTKEFKLLELHDIHGTFIAAMAFRISGEDGWLMRRAGIVSPMIGLHALGTELIRFDAFHWDDRTMHSAHLYLMKNWDKVKDGDLIDIEFLLGQSEAPKKSER